MTCIAAYLHQCSLPYWNYNQNIIALWWDDLDIGGGCNFASNSIKQKFYIMIGTSVILIRVWLITDSNWTVFYSQNMSIAK